MSFAAMFRHKKNAKSLPIETFFFEYRLFLYYCLCSKLNYASTHVFLMLFCADFLVVAASIVVLTAGSNGQVFATSAIRFVFVNS